jgi:glycosyltransferase involved in cell wall biosynthesis
MRIQDRAKRLCYLALEAPREGQASYVHVHEILDGLRHLGWHTTLIASSHSGAWSRPVAAARALESLWLQAKALRRIRQFDAIYIRAHPLAIVTALAAKIIGKTVVHEVNGPYEDLFIAHPWTARFRTLFTFMQRHQYRLANGLIAVTPELKEWIRGETGHANCRVVANGANVELFRPDAPRTYEVPSKYAVFFGGLAPWHGIKTLLAAVDDAAWPGDVSLVVIGDGPEAPRVADAAKRNSRIVALGRVPYRKVGGLVAGAAVGVIPISDPLGRSRTGLAPIKLYETLACGIPAIVSDLPGQADFVLNHGCGAVFRTDDPADLAKCVRQIASDPISADAMGRRGRAVVERGHSWQQRSADTHRFLSLLLDGD